MPRKIDIICDKCCAMMGRQRKEDVEVGRAICRACHLKSFDAPINREDLDTLCKVVFKADHRCFNKGDAIEFTTGVNVLVGDQGSGKSTLIGCLADMANLRSKSVKADMKIKIAPNRKRLKKGMDVRWFDFEKHNPRTKSHVDGGADVASRFMSHGEFNREFIKTLEEDHGEPVLYLLDEPEASLSLSSIAKLIRHLNVATERHGSHVILATHHPWIIRAFEEVYCLEDHSWIHQEIYLEDHGPR